MKVRVCVWVGPDDTSLFIYFQGVMRFWKRRGILNLRTRLTMCHLTSPAALHCILHYYTVAQKVQESHTDSKHTDSQRGLD